MQRPNLPDVAVLDALFSEACIMADDGRRMEALGLFEQVLAGYEVLEGPYSEGTQKVLMAMAQVLSEDGMHGEAVVLLEQVLEAQIAVSGEVGADVAVTLEKLGSCWRFQGEYARAHDFLARALSVWIALGEGAEEGMTRCLKALQGIQTLMRAEENTAASGGGVSHAAPHAQRDGAGGE